MDEVELEDESLGGGDGVATALPGRRRSAPESLEVEKLAIVVGD